MEVVPVSVVLAGTVRDPLDQRAGATGRRWYFLVNYTRCTITPVAWNRYAERGNAARDPLLRPDNASIAESEQQSPEERVTGPVRTWWKATAARHHEHAEHGAGGQESNAADERRRNRFQRDSDGEICRAPDQADGNPGDVRQAWWRSGTSHQLILIRGENRVSG